MAVTWDVASLDATKTVGSLSDVVTTVHWTASDAENVGSGNYAVLHSGSAYVAIGLADADSGSFIAYADIGITLEATGRLFSSVAGSFSNFNRNSDGAVIQF